MRHIVHYILGTKNLTLLYPYKRHLSLICLIYGAQVKLTYIAVLLFWKQQPSVLFDRIYGYTTP